MDAKEVLQKSAVLSALLPRLRAATQDITIASPYFVPGTAGSELLVGLAQRGISVRILTNSLAANDVAAVYGGYSRYREDLLKGGVQLWELKPRSKSQADASLLGSSGASLHAKTLSIDHSGIFVGSYNLDTRSTNLNAEMGVSSTAPNLRRAWRRYSTSRSAVLIPGVSPTSMSLYPGAMARRVSAARRRPLHGAGSKPGLRALCESILCYDAGTGALFQRVPQSSATHDA